MNTAPGPSCSHRPDGPASPGYNRLYRSRGPGARCGRRYSSSRHHPRKSPECPLNCGSRPASRPENGADGPRPAGNGTGFARYALPKAPEIVNPPYAWGTAPDGRAYRNKYRAARRGRLAPAPAVFLTGAAAGISRGGPPPIAHGTPAGWKYPLCGRTAKRCCLWRCRGYSDKRFFVCSD